MANDRIYLGCKVCGEDILLYKYYPQSIPMGLSAALDLSGGYIPHRVEHIEAFMRKHLMVKFRIIISYVI